MRGLFRLGNRNSARFLTSDGAGLCCHPELTWEVPPEGGYQMTHLEISGLIGGILAIMGGITVIVWPRIIAYIIGTYLIIVGILAVMATLR